MQQSSKRRLVALMFTDIVGYSSLTEKNEQLAFDLLEEHRRIFRSIFPRFGGVENKTVGDAFFLEFGSVVEAVRCAIEVQTEFFERDAASPNAQKLQVRIGIHVADVIDSDDDSYGEGVNIAARIEGLADAGGICVSRQVHDHIQNDLTLSTVKVGAQKLKNIVVPVTIYRIVLPWQRASQTPINIVTKALSQIKKLSEMGTPGALVVAFLGVFAFVVFGMYSSYNMRHLNVVEEYVLDKELKPLPQTGSKGKPIDLFETNWEYSVSDPGQTGSEVWEPFDIKNSWKYADEIDGRVRLRTKFKISGYFVRPTIILGRVSGSHRVYLNGQYIGGSNHLSNIQYYSFDRELLHATGENELVVVSHTSQSLMPGISPLRSVGCLLGEFNDIYNKIHENDLNFHLVNSIYLAISFLVCLLCFGFFAFQKTYREYLYFGMFLFLGCMALSYYNIFLSTFLDFRLHRFIKMCGLTTSSFILLSTYFYLTGRNRSENICNLFTIGFLGFLAYVMVARASDATEFLKLYNSILMFTTVCSVIWVAIAGFDWFSSLGAKKRSLVSSDLYIRNSYQIIIVGFGVVTTLMVFNAIKGSSSIFPISPEFRSFLKSVNFVYPFIFSMFILFAGSLDYSRKMRWMGYRRKRADLLLEIVPIKEIERDAILALTLIQEKISRFVKSERSSIYLLEKSPEGRRCLRLGCVLGTHEIKKSIKEEIKPDSGILGYVFRTKSSLLIRDIARDSRFREDRLLIQGESTSYRSGSCMIFPLVVKSEIVGVLTLADKADGAAFTKEEFALARVIGADLASIIFQYQAGTSGEPVVVDKYAKTFATMNTKSA